MRIDPRPREKTMNDARRRFAVLCAFLLACLGAAMPVRAMEMAEARREEPGGVHPPGLKPWAMRPCPSGAASTAEPGGTPLCGQRFTAFLTASQS